MQSSEPGSVAGREAIAEGMTRESLGDKVTLVELEQMTHAYADRYTTLMATACDALEANNPSLEQRRLAHRFKTLTVTSIYDIATNADPFTQLVDMILVVTLESQVWIDEGKADDIFGDRAQSLVGPLRRAREDVWDIGARVMTPEQLEVLDFMIWDWRKNNPDVQIVAMVRFGDFAASRGKSVIADVRAGGGFLAPVDEAKKAVDEARLLGERVFYLSKRLPFLLGWQTESVANELLSTPELAHAISSSEALAASVDRVATVAERLPQESAEIRAVVNDAKALAETTRPVAEAGERFAAGLREASDALTRAIDAADRLYGKVAGPQGSTQTGERFDLDKYVGAADHLTTTIKEMNGLLASSEHLLVSDAWTKRITDINTTLTAQMNDASLRSRGLLDLTFWRGLILMGAFFVMLTAYRALSIRMRASMAPAGAGLNRERGQS